MEAARTLQAAWARRVPPRGDFIMSASACASASLHFYAARDGDTDIVNAEDADSPSVVVEAETTATPTVACATVNPTRRAEADGPDILPAEASQAEETPETNSGTSRKDGDSTGRAAKSSSKALSPSPPPPVTPVLDSASVAAASLRQERVNLQAGPLCFETVAATMPPVPAADQWACAAGITARVRGGAGLRGRRTSRIVPRAAGVKSGSSSDGTSSPESFNSSPQVPNAGGGLRFFPRAPLRAMRLKGTSVPRKVE